MLNNIWKFGNYPDPLLGVADNASIILMALKGLKFYNRLG